MRARIAILVGGLVITVPSAVLSGPIGKHERRQERRINKGERSGSLTDKEAQKLEDKQDAIQEERAEAKEDGKVTDRERKSIRHEQRELSGEIYRKKHNERHE